MLQLPPLEEQYKQVRSLLKKFSRALALLVVPPLGALLIRVLSFTNKKVIHSSFELNNEPVIIASWHGELLMVPCVYKHFVKKPKVKILISEHFDGHLIAKTVRYFQLDTVRGSTTRGGAKALIQLLKALKDGYTLGITPDGPKGPRHSISDGIIVLAQKTAKKVILISVKPSSYWQLKSWDKFIIPKPFGTIEYFISEPLDLTDLEFEAARSLLQERLLAHAD